MALRPARAYIPPENVIPRTVIAVLLVALALAAAIALRVPQLELRPMHTDEAVLALKQVEPLLDSGRFVYDPTDYHGPTLAYSTWLLCQLTGRDSIEEATKTVLRLVPVIYGVGLILLLVLAADGLGRVSVGFAALFTAVSPMMVFYSRYFIMETPFVFFTFGAIACGWRYFVGRRVGWAIAAGVFLGLMHATKETCVISYAAMGAGILGAVVTDYFARGSGLGVINRNRPDAIRPAHLFIAVGTAVVVSATLMSGFFTHWRGILDSVLTYGNYLRRSEGSGHEKPLLYYVSLLTWQRRDGFVWTELPILILAAIGAVSAFVSQPERNRSLHFVRFLAIYAAATLAAYSVIRYKTPWSIMVFQHAAIVLAGFGAFRTILAFRSTAPRVVVVLLILAGAGFLARQAYWQNFRFASHPRNPYVYSHTSQGFERLVDRIHQLEGFTEGGRPLTVQVAHPEMAWPLPWYLRGMKSAGFHAAFDPSLLSADVLVVPVAMQNEVAGLAAGSHVTDDLYGLRPDVILAVFIRRPLWDRFMDARRRAGP